MNSGVKGSMAGTSLAQGITRLLAPTDGAKDAMKKYGVEVAKSADGGINLKGTIENLRASFSKMDKDVQVANAKLILGQTALKGWLPLITTSAEEYNKLSDAIYGSKGATREMMDEIEKSSAYQFKMMKSAIEDFLIVVGDTLAPALKDVSAKIGDFTTKLSNWVSKMRETNPELLALIGKIGLLAVVIPPIIMMFGTFTLSLGNIFKSTSSTINAFVKFSKEIKMVKEGVKLAEGKVGLLAKGLGTLITSFGGATVAITAGLVALAGLTIAVGGNEKALSWLQEKWGTFGAVVGGICENINGWFTLVFGNLGNLVKGVWKSTVAIFTGNKRDLGNIWRDTWADIENTTVKAKSRIGVESTKAIREMRNASQEELALVEKGFETVYNSISNLTKNNYKDVAKDLVTFVSETSGETLSIMRGTSDSMAMLFNNIFTSDSPERMLKQLEKNLKTMASTGKYSAESLKKDFDEAFKLIQINASTSSHRVGEEVKQITKYIDRLAQDGWDGVAKNISGTLKDINEDTFNTLKSLGKNWQTLFEGVELGSENNATVIVENLKKMGEDTSKIIGALNEEFKNGFDETGKAINKLVNGSTQATTEALATMVETIKNGSEKGLEETADIFAKGLEKLDVETIKSLQLTSDQWYSILNGTVNENGELIENFAQQIMWNLGWVSQQSPEKLEGFKDGLLNTLVEANIITADEMKVLVETVEGNVDNATKATTEGFAKMVESIKDNTGIGIEEMASIFATGLEKLDAESIVKLQGTSDQWYSILNGAVDENGKLVEGFANHILWNLGWVSEQSPEKLEGFKDGLLNALVEANLITADEMKALVEEVGDSVDDVVDAVSGAGCAIKDTISNNAEEVVDAVSGAGYAVTEELKESVEDSIDAVSGAGIHIKEELIPKDTATAVKEELDAISGAYHEKTQTIADASAKAGEEAQKQFDEKVSQLGKDVQVDSNIINVEALGTQFQNAGTLAVQNFVLGWSNNKDLITEAINLALTTITNDFSSQFEIINLNIDGVVQKTVILSDNVIRLKDNISLLDGVGFTKLGDSINKTNEGIKQIFNSTTEAKTEVANLGKTSINSLINDLKITNKKMIEVKNSTQKASTEIQNLNKKSTSNVTSQLDKFKTSIDKSKNSLVKLIEEVDKLIGKSFEKIHSQIDGISSRLSTAIEKSITLKYRLSDLNYISFDSLINRLASINSWLSSVRNSARNTSYAIQEVKAPRLLSYDGVNTESTMGSDYLSNIYARTPFDINKYQTRGGYYSPSSMAGTSVRALEAQSQKEQLAILKEQNDLLRQLLLATINIGGDLNVSVDLDGKQVARTTVKYMEVELNNLNKRKSRLGGAF